VYTMVYLHTYTCALGCTFMHTRVHQGVPSYIHVHIRVCLHTYTCTLWCTFIHTRVH